MAPYGSEGGVASTGALPDGSLPQCLLDFADLWWWKLPIISFCSSLLGIIRSEGKIMLKQWSLPVRPTLPSFNLVTCSLSSTLSGSCGRGVQSRRRYWCQRSRDHWVASLCVFASCGTRSSLLFIPVNCFFYQSLADILLGHRDSCKNKLDRLPCWGVRFGLGLWTLS